VQRYNGFLRFGLRIIVSAVQCSYVRRHGNPLEAQRRKLFPPSMIVEQIIRLRFR
jgi:hypothetical protein